jgi:hypothetical protein
MSSFAGLLPNILLWFSIAALLTIAGLLLWRRIWSQLPFFFLYILSAPVIGVVRYLAFPLSKTAYFYVYWISELAAAVIFSAALYEVFLRRLFPRFYRVRFYRSLFPATALVILLGTIAAVMESSDRNSAFQVASRVFDFARTAGLVFFMLLMSFMGRQWSRYDFGITLGFGVQAAAALANAATRARIGHRSATFDTLETIAFEFSCLIWFVTFIKPEHQARLQVAESVDAEVLHQARKWESVLKHWLT